MARGEERMRATRCSRLPRLYNLCAVSFTEITDHRSAVNFQRVNRGIAKGELAAIAIHTPEDMADEDIAEPPWVTTTAISPTCRRAIVVIQPGHG